jgi:nucleotide-binding universal stress UspA family protein
MTYQDREYEHPGRVIVGVDTTLSGLQALRLAVTEARARGMALHAVRTWGPAPVDQLGPAAGQPAVGLVRQPTAGDPTVGGAAALGSYSGAVEAAAVIDRAFADTMGGEPPDLPVRTVLMPDLPGPVLVEYACRDGDLLVIGAGRRRFPFRWRASPVARYCLRHAACPVLVVPPPPLTRAGSPRALLRELRREIDQLADGGSDG